MIELIDVHKSYGAKKVLKGVSLSFEPGSIAAILGPNGSGKTTLIKSVIGMVLPEQGEIRVDGESIKSKSKYRKRIAYLPQMARFPDNLKVSEIISMVADLRQEQAEFLPLLKSFELTGKLEQPLKALSGGMLQKINLLLALMVDSDHLILDEPTAGLDPMAMQRLRQIMKQRQSEGKAILLTTHIMSFAEEMADRIIYLLDGKVYFDGPREELLRRYDEPSLEGAIAKLLQGFATPNDGLSATPRHLVKSVEKQSSA